MSLGDLPARSCARMRLVLCGRDFSDILTSGAGFDSTEFGLYEFRHSLTAIVCIVLRFCVMDSGVGVVVLSFLMTIVFPLQLSNIVGFFFLSQFGCLVRSCRGCVGS